MLLWDLRHEGSQMAKTKLEEAIEFIEECQNTHVEWIKYQQEPDWEEQVREEAVSDSVGDTKHHQYCVDKYDIVLSILEKELRRLNWVKK